MVVEHAPLSRPPAATVATDDDGRFRFVPSGRGVGATSAELHVVAEGWPRRVTRMPRGEDVRIVLEHGARIGVRVTAAGRAVESASVGLARGGDRPPSPSEVRLENVVELRSTGPDGTVAFLVPKGAYLVRAEAEGLAPRLSEPVTVAAGDARDVEVALTHGTTLAFRVTDAEGSPVAGAALAVGGPLEVVRRGRTDAEGRVTLSHFAPPHERAQGWDAYVFWRILAPGLAPAQGNRQVPASDAQVPIDVRMDRGHAARVRFVDGDGAPVVGVRADLAMDLGQLPDEAPSFVSDDDGRLVVPHLVPLLGGRPWRLLVPARGGDYPSTTVHLDVGGPEPPAEQVVVLRRTLGTLAGTLVDPEGRPVTKGRVGWRPADATAPFAVATASLDGEGRFALKGLTVVPGWVMLRADGWGPQDVATDAEALTSGRLAAFSLRTLGAVGGQVVTREGVPLARTPVELLRPFRDPKENWTSVEPVATTLTDESGRFAFRGVGEEAFQVGAGSAEWLPAMPWPARVRGGDVALRLALKPASEGQGMALVLRPTVHGRAYEGDLSASWKVNGTPWSGGRPQRGPDGRYVFRVLGDPGPYDFDVQAPGHRTASLRGVRMEDRPDPVPVEVPLDPGEILRLRVVGAAGLPLANAWVTVQPNRTLRTDDAGVVEVGGYAAERLPYLDVRLQADPEWTVAILRDVTPPATLDVVLQRVGWVSVELLAGERGPSGDARVRLLRKDGRVVDEMRLDTTKPRPKAHAWFAVPDAGTYRVEASVGDVVREASVDAAPGTHSPVVTIDLR
jgi:hypothetical protein